MGKKNIIITGGYSGIGLELTKLLLKEGHSLGLIIRNEKNKNDLLTRLSLDNAVEIDFFIGDLSNQQQLMDVADEILRKWEKVDILFNNAGVLLEEQLSSIQGNEMHYEVNTLAPYLLATQLKPALINSKNGLVVNTVTGGLHFFKRLNTEELIRPKKFRKVFGSYMFSKLALLLLMNNLADEWKELNIRIINVSPGGNKTKLSTGNGMPAIMRFFVNLTYKKPGHGANLLYDAAFNKHNSDKTGIYIQNKKVDKIKISLSCEDKEKILHGIKS